MIEIKAATTDDFDRIWPIFHGIVSLGDTYTFDRDTSREKAFYLWFELPRATFVATDGMEVVGTYFIKQNHGGGGAHVCNCGYMVSPAARGRGIATLMCEHSQKAALGLGFKAMQFNSVVSSNKGAIRLWKKLGFEVVGNLPAAFQHPELGFIDAKIMYKWLDGALPKGKQK